MTTLAQTLSDSTTWLHLFGDATRLRLLALLEDEELSVAELTRITQLAQSRVSTHLGKLRDAGLVLDRRVGSSSRYRLHAAMPEPAAALWRMLRAQLDDDVLAADATRREALRDPGENWPERVAGEMERHYSPGRTWEALVHGLAALLDLGDVVDVGCGDGWTARLLAPRSTSYVGVDRSERVLSAAKKRTRGVANATFLHGTMEALPVDDASADTALLFHTLTYSEAPHDALREVSRVLRPQGRLVLVTLDAHDDLETTRAYGHVQPGFAPRALRRLLTRAGLATETCARTSVERKKPGFGVVTATAIKE